MPDQNPTIRSVAWQEIFPWLLIVRCWGLSVAVPFLCLATVAVILSPLGSWIGSHLFLPAEVRQEITDPNVGSWPDPHRMWSYRIPQSVGELWGPALAHVDVAVHRFARAWQNLLRPPRTLGETAYLVFGGLWSLAVWALFAGAITRMAAVQLGCDQRTTMTQALRFTLTRFRSYFVAPLLPLAPLVIGIMMLSVLGWIGQNGFGLLLVGVGWPLVLLGAGILTILLLGLALGWPMMWVALGAELDADAFEAVSRGYTYALQRPFRLIGYVTVATLVGLVGWIVVYHTSEILIGLANSGLSPQVFAEPQEGITSSSMFQIGASLILLGNSFVRTVATAYGFSFFFCAATAIYLLLRRDIDEAQFDQIFDDQQEEPLELPPLPTDDLTSVPKDSDVPESGSPASDTSDREMSESDGANRVSEDPPDSEHPNDQRD